MPGNMNNLLKQAQRMQRQMEEQQKEMAEKEFKGTAGGGAVEIEGCPEATAPDIYEENSFAAIANYCRRNRIKVDTIENASNE